MEITCLTIDCHDPVALATWWNDALGWGGVAGNEQGAVTGPPDGSMYLEFIRVPEEKVTKNRLHLGCSAGTLDELDTTLTRLYAAGATLAWEEEFPPEVAAVYRNVILRDPEGNEFCLGGGSHP